MAVKSVVGRKNGTNTRNGRGTNENSASVPLHRELVNLERGNKTIGGCPKVKRMM